jgi:hypothetical protein
MTMQRFKIHLADPEHATYDPYFEETQVRLFTVDIEVDDSLIPDEKWKSTFYSGIQSLEHVSRHIIWNRVIMQFREVEGFADKEEGVDWIIHSSSYEWVNVDRAHEFKAFA